MKSKTEFEEKHKRADAVRGAFFRGNTKIDKFTDDMIADGNGSHENNICDFSTHVINEKGEFETSLADSKFDIHKFIASFDKEQLHKLSVELRKHFPELTTDAAPKTPAETRELERDSEITASAAYHYRWYHFLIEMWNAFLNKMTITRKDPEQKKKFIIDSMFEGIKNESN